jgi:ABC-type arginine/histidine transport system permease subunit
VKREWYLAKWVASNLILFVVAFFLTTPAEVVSQLDKVLITIFGPSASTQVYTYIYTSLTATPRRVSLFFPYSKLVQYHTYKYRKFLNWFSLGIPFDVN